MSKEDIKAQLEAEETKIDQEFSESVNELMKKYNRILVAVPTLIPDNNGMKISAQITIQRSA